MAEEEIEEEYLPEDIMFFEILVKLPVKDVVRFKSVSRSFRSLISSPVFGASHFKVAASPTDRLVCLEPDTDHFLSIDFNVSLMSCTLLDLQFMQQSEYLGIIASCRGFLLLNFQHAFCVWNPSTGLYKSIPLSNYVSTNLSSDTFYVCVSGFGYDSSQDDYLVILVTEDTGHDLTHSEYYSFRTNSWRDIETTHWGFSHTVAFAEGSFSNGAINWLAYSFTKSNVIIIAFDLTERNYSDISLPVAFELKEYELGVLKVMREMLHLCDQRNRFQIDIWVMREYKVHSSWTKTFSLSLNDLPFRTYVPISYTTSGDIVGVHDNSALVKYNTQGEVLEIRFNLGGEHQWHVYTESLLSLPPGPDQAN